MEDASAQQTYPLWLLGAFQEQATGKSSVRFAGNSSRHCLDRGLGVRNRMGELCWLESLRNSGTRLFVPGSGAIVTLGSPFLPS